MFVVTVHFSVKRNQIEQFKPLMLENARLSLELEPGCKQFDVSTPVNLGNAFCMRFMMISPPLKSIFKCHILSCLIKKLPKCWIIRLSKPLL